MKTRRLFLFAAPALAVLAFSVRIAAADAPVTDADFESWRVPSDCASIQAEANPQTSGAVTWQRATLQTDDPKLKFTMLVPTSDGWSLFGKPLPPLNIVDGKHEIGRPGFFDKGPKGDACPIDRQYAVYAEKNTVKLMLKSFNKGAFGTPPSAAEARPVIQLKFGTRPALLLPHYVFRDGAMAFAGYELIVQHRANGIVHLAVLGDADGQGLLDQELFRMADSIK